MKCCLIIVLKINHIQCVALNIVIYSKYCYQVKYLPKIFT